jgi:uncharacterized protein with HEPN domain
MSDDRLQIYLDRIRTASSRAATYVAQIDRPGFEADQKTQDAVIANIAAIGECVTKIIEKFPDFAASHPEVPWRDIKAMRNRVAHQYFEIDVDTVWRTVTTDIPELLRLLNAIEYPSGQPR